jgi:hypothetical protein
MKFFKNSFVGILIITGSTIATISCTEEPEEPGPISIENNITPTTVNDGNTITWKINVTNSGGEVNIERIHVREEFISGWAEGLGTVEVDLPLSNITVGEHSTKTVYSISTPVTNIGSTDVGVKNTVTVYSNGGTETDIVYYTITKSSKKSNNMESKTLLLKKIL